MDGEVGGERWGNEGGIKSGGGREATRNGGVGVGDGKGGEGGGCNGWGGRVDEMRSMDGGGGGGVEGGRRERVGTQGERWGREVWGRACLYEGWKGGGGGEGGHR